MTIRKIDQSNLADAISLVARLNQDITHKISYFGDTEDLGFNYLVQQNVPRIPQKVFCNQGTFLVDDLGD
jgi:hypothetical protein